MAIKIRFIGSVPVMANGAGSNVKCFFPYEYVYGDNLKFFDSQESRTNHCVIMSVSVPVSIEDSHGEVQALRIADVFHGAERMMGFGGCMACIETIAGLQMEALHTTKALHEFVLEYAPELLYDIARDNACLYLDKYDASSVSEFEYIRHCLAEMNDAEGHDFVANTVITALVKQLMKVLITDNDGCQVDVQADGLSRESYGYNRLIFDMTSCDGVIFNVCKDYLQALAGYRR